MQSLLVLIFLNYILVLIFSLTLGIG